VKENDYEFSVPLDIKPPNFVVRRVLVDKLANTEKDARK
jgi:hypothetical protein